MTTVINTSESMRAAIVESPGNVRIANVPVPEPAAGQVRVRLEGCGVCASNLPPWAGREWFQYPMEPGRLGHEGWGRIDAVGEGVDRFRLGERVAILSNHSYAEYDVANQDAVVPIPAQLDDVPLPGEPLGCAVNIFRRSGVNPRETVAVVGVGFLGALLVRLFSGHGARVIAIARRQTAIDTARSMGAAETIPMDDHWRIIEQVKALTDGRLCDVVVEATGHQWPLDLSAELTRVRGRMVVAGYHQDGPRSVNMQLWNWRGLDVINAHERELKVNTDGVRLAIDSILSGAMDPTPLYTHRYPLERLADALDATRDRPEGFMKALIMMNPVGGGEA